MSMKYDAGMTQYHSNIATAIKRMCRHDKTAMKLVKDASPAPLREHLKKSYKYNGAGDASSFYQGSPKDMKIEFNGESIILSWSQVAKFIRDNPSEIFDDYNALSNQPVCECNTENNKTYLEVFREHYPNVDVGILYEEYCPEEFFENGTGANDGECQENCCFCWSAPAKSEWSESEGHYVPEEWKAAETDTEEFSDEELEQDRAALKGAIADVSEKHIDCPYYKKGAALNYICYGAVHFECQKHEEEFSDPHKLKVFINNHCYNSVWCNYCQEQKPQDKPAELPTVQPERAAEVSESFNYAVLTAELGDYLKHMEEKLRNEYMNFTANCGRIFAEAQEKLSGSNQYNGLFEKWFTAMGFAKTTVYRMIDIYKFRSSQIGTSEQAQLFDSLSKTLQADISAPSAPPKLVEQVMNGDITTHKEYIRLKKELEEAQEKAAFWNKANTATNEENQKLRAERVNAMNRADNAERELSEAQAKIEKLNREADEADREYDAMADRECHYETEICELEQRIKELENRPVDVAVDVDELNRRVAEVTNKMNSEMEHTLAEERRGFADTLNAKDDRIWELEDELAELRDHNTELDFGDGSNSLSADQLSEIYETLHGKVISALKDCKAFISINNLPQIVKDRASGKFGTLKELIEWYIEEME